MRLSGQKPLRLLKRTRPRLALQVFCARGGTNGQPRLGPKGRNNLALNCFWKGQLLKQLLHFRAESRERGVLRPPRHRTQTLQNANPRSLGVAFRGGGRRPPTSGAVFSSASRRWSKSRCLPAAARVHSMEPKGRHPLRGQEKTGAEALSSSASSPL